MWKKFAKYIKKKRTHGFTIMVVPNTDGNVRSICIPSVVVLIIVALLIYDVYAIFSFHVQISQIMTKNAIIRQQKKDLKQVEPSIQRTEQLVKRMQEQEQLEANVRNYLRIVQNKAGHHGSVSRSVRPSTLFPERLNYVSNKSGKDANTRLAYLNNNIEYIEEKNPEVQNDLEALLNDLKAFNNEFDHTPSVWPAYGRVTSGFGVRVHPISRRVTSHTGLDIKVRTGTAVHAAADGIVEFSGYRGGYGWTVVINHGYGYKTLYAHNSRLLVQVGTRVAKGDRISFSGSSGSSTGPHLHYEIVVNNNRVNPISFLNR